MEKAFSEPGSLKFKDRPLVRSDKTIYYGDMGDKFIAMLQILGEEQVGEQTLPNRIAVQLWSTDEELRPRDRVIKKTEKTNLYDALNVASIWLERQLDGK